MEMKKPRKIEIGRELKFSKKFQILEKRERIGN